MTHPDWVQKTAHPIANYPEIDDLIDDCTTQLLAGSEFTYKDALRAVRDVFVGLAKADVHGHIAVADEHEWAAVAVRANQRGTLA